jgi:hypothetical protein
MSSFRTVAGYPDTKGNAMRNPSRKSAGAAALCALAANGFCGELLYDCAGPVTVGHEGWTFLPSDGAGKVYHVSEGFGVDKGGQWLGPALPAEGSAFRFYGLEFDARAPNGGYWGVMFYDASGRALVPDIYSALRPGDAPARYTRVFYGREGAATFRPFVQSERAVELSNLRIRRIPDSEAAEWCDGFYAKLPPLAYTPPANRLALVPKTAAALTSGTPWRVIMLGDSIINDSFNSNFQALIQRAHPKSDLRFICSVRGSTGCWHYQDPEAFREYAANLRPDLLILGGISHREDLEAIRRVIELARREIGCEVILMSGPLGRDWRARDERNPQADLPAQAGVPDPFVARQRALAAEMGVEFIDLATAWHTYLGASRKPWNFFHRDDVHGDDSGKQIVGRILEAYFKPGP